MRNLSTWPWESGTLRRVIAAVLLPILIWVLQFFLGQLLAAQ